MHESDYQALGSTPAHAALMLLLGGLPPIGFGPLFPSRAESMRIERESKIRAARACEDPNLIQAAAPAAGYCRVKCG